MKRAISIILFFAVLISVFVGVTWGCNAYFSPQKFLELLEKVNKPLDFYTYVMGSVADEVPAESIITTYPGPGGGENSGGFAGGSFAGAPSDATANPFAYIGYWFTSAFSFEGWTEFWDGLKYGFFGIGLLIYRVGNWLVSQFAFFKEMSHLLLGFEYITSTYSDSSESSSYVPVLC